MELPTYRTNVLTPVLSLTSAFQVFKGVLLLTHERQWHALFSISDGVFTSIQREEMLILSHWPSKSFY